METAVTRRALLSLVDYGWKEVKHFSEVDGFYIMNHWPLVPGYATILVYEDGRAVSILAGENDGHGGLFSLVITMDFEKMSIHPVLHGKKDVEKIKLTNIKVVETMSNVVSYTALYLGHRQMNEFVKLRFPDIDLAMLALGELPYVNHKELN